MSTHAALPANKHSLPLAVKLLGSMLLVILLAVGFARW